MHPLLAKDLAKVLIGERIAGAQRAAPRRRFRMRTAVGRFLVLIGSKLTA